MPKNPHCLLIFTTLINPLLSVTSHSQSLSPLFITFYTISFPPPPPPLLLIHPHFSLLLLLSTPFHHSAFLQFCNPTPRDFHHFILFPDFVSHLYTTDKSEISWYFSFYFWLCLTWSHPGASKSQWTAWFHLSLQQHSFSLCIYDTTSSSFPLSLYIWVVSHSLTIVFSAEVNMGVHVSFWINVKHLFSSNLCSVIYGRIIESSELFR